jgi:hypothetical protein
MTIEHEATLGVQAERILEEVSPYFDMVENAILDKWKESPIADKEGQHELRLMYKLLGDLKANIRTAIDTGKMAQIQIERESKLLQFARKVF